MLLNTSCNSQSYALTSKTNFPCVSFDVKTSQFFFGLAQECTPAFNETGEAYSKLSTVELPHSLQSESVESFEQFIQSESVESFEQINTIGEELFANVSSWLAPLVIKAKKLDEEEKIRRLEAHNLLIMSSKAGVETYLASIAQDTSHENTIKQNLLLIKILSKQVADILVAQPTIQLSSNIQEIFSKAQGSVSHIFSSFIGTYSPNTRKEIAYKMISESLDIANKDIAEQIVELENRKNSLSLDKGAQKKLPWKFRNRGENQSTKDFFEVTWGAISRAGILNRAILKELDTYMLKQLRNEKQDEILSKIPCAGEDSKQEAKNLDLLKYSPRKISRVLSAALRHS